MSHFTVLVPAKNDVDLEKVLQPFHEYECTGNNDQYVQDIDITEDVKENGLDWHGLEDRTVESPDDVDINGEHRWGYAIVKDGEIIKAVDRTNPNAKWDWWQIGGRWTGKLLLKSPMLGRNGRPGLMTEPNTDPKRADVAEVGNVDWQGMKDNWFNEQVEWYDSKRKYYDLAVSRIEKKEVKDDESYDAAKVAALKLMYDPETYSKRQELAHETFGDIQTAIAFEYSVALARADKEDWWTREWEDIKKVLMDRDEFIATLDNPYALTYSFIDLEGNWNQRGEMGWFGMDDKDMATNNYDKAWWQFVESLESDQLVYVVDCHI